MRPAPAHGGDHSLVCSSITASALMRARPRPVAPQGPCDSWGADVRRQRGRVGRRWSCRSVPCASGLCGHAERSHYQRVDPSQPCCAWRPDGGIRIWPITVSVCHDQALRARNVGRADSAAVTLPTRVPSLVPSGIASSVAVVFGRIWPCPDSPSTLPVYSEPCRSSCGRCVNVKDSPGQSSDASPEYQSERSKELRRAR